jgi:Flp pilus assembly protein CpaB
MLRIATITIAVIAAFIGVMYLRFSADDNDGVPVVVAEQNIAAGTEISEDMIRVTKMPEDQLVAGAFSDTQPVVGEVTTIAIASGEQITASKVNLGSSDAVCWLCEMPTGKRPLALPIDSPTIDGEPIVPGNRVNILFESDGSTTTVVENVEVLAVDPDGETPPLGALGSTPPSVTVAVGPEQAQILAETLIPFGKIRLSRPT